MLASRRSLQLVLSLGLLSAGQLRAQQAAEAAAAPARTLAERVAGWQGRHGGTWRVEPAPSGLHATCLAGGNLPLAATVVDEAEAARVAALAVENVRDLFGVDPATLELQRVVFLPFGMIGASDKWAVRYVQRHAGVEARAAFMNVLLDVQGRVLSVQSTALVGVERLAAVPRFDALRADELARARFLADAGRAATRTTAAELAWTGPLAADGLVDTDAPRLAWVLEVHDEEQGHEAAGRRYAFDALDGSLVWSAQAVHNFEVRGVVRAFVTPGLAPDSASNPEVATPMRHLRVAAGALSTVTDANGAFSFPSLSAATSVSVDFRGTYNNVLNDAGAEYVLAQTVQPNTDATLTMNPASAALVTSQGNVFHHVNVLRDWVRSVLPGDATADFVMTANVNLAQTCNAYYNGGSTNYFQAGGSCVNTAYSTVITHECGHWLNDRYGTGNGPDGMGEGNADVFAMYVHDSALLGQDFCGAGCGVRTGTNTRQFCGDLFGGCYGEVHADGEVWMGAAWKVRERLGQALGGLAGDAAANLLFLGWMNAYNQGAIKSVIETQWLVLDDDDGNLNNGTPHYAAIDGGFRAQGFPGVELRPLTIENVVLPGDQPRDRGPYPVDCRIVPQFGQALVEAKLFLRVNGGAWQPVDLVPQGDGRYAHHVPPVVAPSQVDWYLRAVDALGNTTTSPAGAPAASHAFRVGSPVSLGVEGFDAGPAGWTSGTWGDTSNLANDWEHGVPSGKSGSSVQGTTPISWRDPAAAASAPYCFGTDILPAGNGAYPANAHTWLRSPPLDFSGRYGLKLRYKRWLSTQISAFDQARIRVNGAIVWTNSDSTPTNESAWSVHELDISDHADNRAGVVVEFELKTDGSVNLGGWAVDDVEFLALGPGAPPAGPGAPVGYGPGKPNSLGLAAVLAAYGTPAFSSNDFQIQIYAATPAQQAVLYSSPNYAATPILGGLRLIGTPYAREAWWTLNGFGESYHSPTILPSMVGATRYYQALYRDPQNPDGSGAALSRGLRVEYGP